MFKKYLEKTKKLNLTNPSISYYYYYSKLLINNSISSY